MLQAAGQDIASKRVAAKGAQALQLGMEGSANLLRVKKEGIDAGGSVARPESTILSERLFIQAEP
jgi:hypothetical protein